MQSTDPLIPIYALVIGYVSFALGYLLGRVRDRCLIRRYERSYGSLVTRSR